MMTPREMFLEMLKPDGQPDGVICQYDAFSFCLGDPVSRYLSPRSEKGVPFKNKWGVTRLWEIGAPGPIPLHDEEHKVIKDITHWKESPLLEIPDIKNNCQEGWDEFVAQSRAKTGPDKLLTAFMGTGMFEQCHAWMDFSDTLTALYEHPKEMHEMIEAICEVRCENARLLIDKLHPDVLFTHDDWGTKNALFMPPDMWREFFKEPYRKFYKIAKDAGVIAVHHADSYLVPILEDMIEIGIDCWQGVLPENNIPKIQQELGGRLILMGGLGAVVDTADSTEEEIRAYTRKVLSENCPGGHYIPSVTYGLAGTIYPHVDPIFNDEIRRYNEQLHLPHYTYKPRRNKDAAASAEAEKFSLETESASDQTLSDIARALKKGQKSKLMKLVDQALAENITAADILEKGLVVGMDQLGKDFSAGKAFVPEMLIAAKCMDSATAVLKELLAAGGGAKASGKAVLGTVKGDMHDIGKNLVRIMLEGAGIEVIDLGANVESETFVDAAVENNADIICMSSLLTTSMGHMGEVIELLKQKGLRDRFKVMIGGAPTSQGFCDEIGADSYSVDAGEAARNAVAILSAKN